MKQDQPRNEATGKFKTDSEPNTAKLTFRCTSSLRAEIEQVAGENVADWLREAAIEKLERDKAQRLDKSVSAR